MPSGRAVPQAEHWSDVEIRRAEYDDTMFVWKPYGELDFITLPSSIRSIGVGPNGVTFQCADGRLYYLTGDPCDIDTWAIRSFA
jgi:hypothetical protein